MAWTEINDQRRKTYQCWQDMKSRCYNKNSQQFKNYGARGISVCDEWLTSFGAFLADMGLKPDGLTLDRINNELGYSPSNCRWATRAEQRKNQRTCHYIEFNGKRQTLTDWAREIGINEETLSARILKRGWSEERALTTPIITPVEIARMGGHACRQKNAARRAREVGNG